MTEKPDTTDLYALLGVARDADQAAIKSAFRKLSKTAHPDAGGKPGEFEALKQAFDILSDEAARARYDRTGMIDPGGKAYSAAVNTEIMSAVTEIYMALAQQNKKAKHIKIITSLVSVMTTKRENVRVAVKLARRVAEDLLDSETRFKRRNGDNVMAELVRFQREGVDGDIKNMVMMDECLTAAIELVQQHGFDQEMLIGSGDRPNYAGVFFKMGPMG